MSLVKLPHCPVESDTHRVVRPKFNQRVTQDRLREAVRKPSVFYMFSKIRKDRKSVFKEVGLALEDGSAMADDKQHTVKVEDGLVSLAAPLDMKSAEAGSTTEHTHTKDKDGKARVNDISARPSKQEYSAPMSQPEPLSPQSLTSKTPWYAKVAIGRRPRVRTESSAPPTSFQGLSRLTMIVLALALVIPIYGRDSRDSVGIADAVPTVKRAKSPTDVCTRWAMQSESPSKEPSNAIRGL